MSTQTSDARVFRYKAALREYAKSRGMEADQHWQAMLIIVTAADSLWKKAQRYLDFKNGSAYLDDMVENEYLSGGEIGLLSLARNLFNGGAEVDIAGLADTLDDTVWPAVLEALAVYRGDKL